MHDYNCNNIRIFHMSMKSNRVFFTFSILSPLGKGRSPFIWTNLNPPHPRMLCAKFGWKWLSGSGEEDFLISSMYFCYFVIISLWKRAGPFIWTNLNPLHPRMLCVKFGWNWPSGFGEDENAKILQQPQQRRQQQQQGWRTMDKFWSE